MMIPIGYENFVDSDSIVVVLSTDSAPAMRLRRGAKESRRLINATSGRKARSLIVMKSNHIILSALQPETIKSRLKQAIPKERDMGFIPSEKLMH